MKIRSVHCVLLAFWMLLGFLTGCAPSTGKAQNAEQYIDPVYPPYYEIVYQDLFGADFDTVVEKLGYTREDFVLVEDLVSFYRTEKTVTYLDQEFQLELWFFDGEPATRLCSVALYKEIPGTTKEQSKLAFEFGENIKKMFGDHTEECDEELEKRYVLDLALLEDGFSGMEDKNWEIDFRLTDEISHIPQKGLPLIAQAQPDLYDRDKVDVQLKYWVFCYPGLEVPPSLRISYQTGMKHAGEFVRN